SPAAGVAYVLRCGAGRVRHASASSSRSRHCGEYPMKRQLLAGIVGAALIGSSLIAPMQASAQTAVTEQEAHAIGVEAYLYFYSLVTMDLTRRQSTNIEAGKELGKGPMNMFVNVPEYPPADFKGVVRPNFDTLYSVAWLDLTKEPVIVSVPDT